MCRQLCYLGLPVTLAELVLEPPHSLAVQSYAPADMRGGGTVNADGFGVGWFAPWTEPEQAASARPSQARRYRRPAPIWQDAAFAELARGTVAVGVLAAVRNATAGMPVAEAACAPFTDGQWLFSLNGLIAGWPDSAVWLADSLPRRELLDIQVMTDAALLWAVLRQRLAGTADPAAALAGLVAEVLDAAPGSRLTTLLTDGRQIYATTVTHSLWSRHSAAGVLVASEPFDSDPGWQPIPDSRLVTADRAGVRHRSLVPEVESDAALSTTRSGSHAHHR